jgi:hypothetical protein
LQAATAICDAHADCSGITRDNGGYEPRKGSAGHHVAAHELWMKQAAPTVAPTAAAGRSVGQESTWVIGAAGKDCDLVCAGLDGSSCNQTALNSLNGISMNDLKTYWSKAGMSCSPSEPCSGSNNCVRWGSPYIHEDTNNGGKTGGCTGGSKPSVAPCNQAPSDKHHQRLCPCHGEVSCNSVADCTAANSGMQGFSCTAGVCKSPPPTRRRAQRRRR